MKYTKMKTFVHSEVDFGEGCDAIDNEINAFLSSVSVKSVHRDMCTKTGIILTTVLYTETLID